MSEEILTRVTVPEIMSRKKGGPKIVCLTAYDYPTARLLDETGAIDIILVGDSLGMVVLGYESTIPVTMEEMIHHTRAARRGTKRALLVADMPYLSYQLGEEEAVRNATRFIKECGASAVKIEGATSKRLKLVRILVEAEIPVMGHVGLTPQSINKFGKYKVQGTTSVESARLVKSARDLEKAGAFSVVIESVPMEVARRITDAVSIPTIGIGAGPACDGQVLVIHDLLGLSTGHVPKFVKQFADLKTVISSAVREFAREVRNGVFPDDATSYHLALGDKARLEKRTTKAVRRERKLA